MAWNCRKTAGYGAIFTLRIGSRERAFTVIDNLIRGSAGIEDQEDLIEDFSQAIEIMEKQESLPGH